MRCGPPVLDAVDLYWVPLGAGSRVVPACGRAYESLVARRADRQRRDLYHAALEVHLDGARWTIESAPAWDRAAPDRGVVGTGPVAAPWLGRWQWFRYEVRRWPDGRIPDADAAVASPVRLSADHDHAQRLFAAVPSFPTWTWGRDEQALGDMWNSNSLVAWLLARSDHAVDELRPPPSGRAPGWAAGVAAARAAAPPATPDVHPLHPPPTATSSTTTSPARRSMT